MAISTSTGSLGTPAISLLGPDPTHFAGHGGARTHVLNGNAFQQDSIITSAGWQYVAFYSAGKTRTPSPLAASTTADNHVEPVFVHLARRKVLPQVGPWQTLIFDDYPQTTDDGHNTVQLGICPGDGTIHLSYDHHCDRLRYRHSVPRLALDPEAFAWTTDNFTSTLSTLPGLASDDPEIEALLGYVTYPRFGPLGTSKLWFSFRTGKAGLGDDHLAIYDPATASYSRPLTHLKGVDSNPYINGLDYRACQDESQQANTGRLYTTWVYRGFVWYPGWDDPNDTKHKAQAGPNGGENNHDLCFAYSGDEGATWRNSADDLVAGKGGSIEPSSQGIRAFEIPKNSGLANQESQAVDHDGGVHVLNRDCLPTGADKAGDASSSEIRWKHYYRSPQGLWTQTVLPNMRTAYGGKRGQVAVNRRGDLYFILPTAITSVSVEATTATTNSSPPTQKLLIMKATKTSNYTDHAVVWSGGISGGTFQNQQQVLSTTTPTERNATDNDAPRDLSMYFPPTEFLVDKARLDHEDVLSVFARMYHPHGGSNGVERGRVEVAVLDFAI